MRQVRKSGETHRSQSASPRMACVRASTASHLAALPSGWLASPCPSLCDALELCVEEALTLDVSSMCLLPRRAWYLMSDMERSCCRRHVHPIGWVDRRDTGGRGTELDRDGCYWSIASLKKVQHVGEMHQMLSIEVDSAIGVTRKGREGERVESETMDSVWVVIAYGPTVETTQPHGCTTVPSRSIVPPHAKVLVPRG